MSASSHVTLLESKVQPITSLIRSYWLVSKRMMASLLCTLATSMENVLFQKHSSREIPRLLGIKRQDGLGLCLGLGHYLLRGIREVFSNNRMWAREIAILDRRL
jgi:hypothetical protein